MMPRQTRNVALRGLLVALFAASVGLALSGCNMLQGLGNDISEVSRATEEFIGGNPDD